MNTDSKAILRVLAPHFELQGRTAEEVAADCAIGREDARVALEALARHQLVWCYSAFHADQTFWGLTPEGQDYVETRMVA